MENFLGLVASPSRSLTASSRFLWNIQEPTMASKGQDCPEEASVEKELELELERVVVSVRAGPH